MNQFVYIKSFARFVINLLGWLPDELRDPIVIRFGYKLVFNASQIRPFNCWQNPLTMPPKITQSVDKRITIEFNVDHSVGSRKLRIDCRNLGDPSISKCDISLGYT